MFSSFVVQNTTSKQALQSLLWVPIGKLMCSTDRWREKGKMQRGEYERGGQKSTLKICKCLGWGALTSVSRIAASIFSVCVRVSQPRCVMTSLSPGFHVLVSQSGRSDMSAEIFCLIETLHKWSCQARPSNRIHNRSWKRISRTAVWRRLFFLPLNKYRALNDYRLAVGESSEWRKVKNITATRRITTGGMQKHMHLTSLLSEPSNMEDFSGDVMQNLAATPNFVSSWKRHNVSKVQESSTFPVQKMHLLDPHKWPNMESAAWVKPLQSRSGGLFSWHRIRTDLLSHCIRSTYCCCTWFTELLCSYVLKSSCLSMACICCCSGLWDTITRKKYLQSKKAWDEVGRWHTEYLSYKMHSKVLSVAHSVIVVVVVVCAYACVAWTEGTNSWRYGGT